jgi:hypothetical protein
MKYLPATRKTLLSLFSLSFFLHQMRYQQKQMHENAQKKSDMFDETQKLLTSSLGAGKVRPK